jgi:uroporphyrin-III C-methyltransferase
MGMNKLKEIMGIFSRFHKDETPVAIIQNGSLPNQKMGIGTVSNITSIAREKRLGSPAIIVIGEVVKVAQKEEFMATILEQLEKKA